MNASTSSRRNARTSRARTRKRTGQAEETNHAKNHQESTLETTLLRRVTLSFLIKILILCGLGVDSTVKKLNKLTLAACRDKKKYFRYSEQSRAHHFPSSTILGESSPEKALVFLGVEQTTRPPVVKNFFSLQLDFTTKL